MVNSYPFGSEVEFSITFKNARTSAPADPSDVVLKIQSAAGLITTYTYSGGQIERLGVGQYFFDFVPDESGCWFYAWEGTGVITASTLNVPFNVEANLFGGSTAPC